MFPCTRQRKGCTAPGAVRIVGTPRPLCPAEIAVRDQPKPTTKCWEGADEKLTRGGTHGYATPVIFSSRGAASRATPVAQRHAGAEGHKDAPRTEKTRWGQGRWWVRKTQRCFWINGRGRLEEREGRGGRAKEDGK